MIIPECSFSCNGRITGYLASLEVFDDHLNSHFTLQVWHPTSSDSGRYSRVGNECPLTFNNINVMTDSTDYWRNVSCTGNNRIEFQSGDVIGYYQNNSLQNQLWGVVYVGYKSYVYKTPMALNTVSIKNFNQTFDEQLLLQIMFGKNYNIEFYKSILYS